MESKKPRGRPKHPDILTPGEWRIVEAVRHGLTNREIADRRGISVDAVKYHIANVLQKLGFARKAELKTWNGVSACSNQSKQEPDMNQETVFGRVGQISRTVADIEAATQWYANVLGLTHLYSFGDLAFFDCDGTRLFLSKSNGEPPQDSIIYFWVEDIERSKSEMEARGVDFTNAPHMVHKHADGTEEWMAFFQDNEGRPLGLMSTATSPE